MTAGRWRIGLWLGAAAVVCAAAWVARGALVPFGVGAVIAYALSPVVDRAAALVPLRGAARESMRRGIAVFAIYVVFGGALFLVAYLVVPIIAGQVTRFLETLPERLTAARGLVDGWLAQYRARVSVDAQDDIGRYAGNVAAALGDTLATTARGTVTLLTGTLEIVFGYLVVPFWMFYVLRDRPGLGRGFMQAVPPVLRDDVANALTITDHLVGRYIRGQLLLGLVVGLAVGVTLTLLQVQLSLTLGVWAGLTELVPIVGPWIGTVPGLLIVAGTQPDLLVPVALTYFVVQQVENNFLVPRVQGHAVDVSSGTVILLLVIGGATFGLLGLIVVVPTAAILRELFWYADRRLSGTSALGAFVASRAGRWREARTVPQAPAGGVPQAPARADDESAAVPPS